MLRREWKERRKEGFSLREREREYVSSSAKGAMAEKETREACKQ